MTFQVHKFIISQFHPEQQLPKYYNDTWCTYAPLQLHVLYTLSRRSVTKIAYNMPCNGHVNKHHSSHVNTLGHTYWHPINYYQACHSNSSNDNLILKTNCGIEMPTKHSTQQVITDHRIVLNSVKKTSPLTFPKSRHKPLNSLSCSSPEKWTIT